MRDSSPGEFILHDPPHQDESHSHAESRDDSCFTYPEDGDSILYVGYCNLLVSVHEAIKGFGPEFRRVCVAIDGVWIG
jgi:hypothetical protein